VLSILGPAFFNGSFRLARILRLRHLAIDYETADVRSSSPRNPPLSSASGRALSFPPFPEDKALSTPFRSALFRLESLQPGSGGRESPLVIFCHVLPLKEQFFFNP